MRSALISTLTRFALENPKIHAILPDIGVFAFKQAGFPEKQTINVGICEQLSTDLAAGLCISGMIPFIYSIAPFVTERCYEQIKMACYNNLPIKIVGVGAGLTYSHEGPSHHAINDISIMRAVPNMYVYSPCSSEETTLIAQEMVNNDKPSYIRLTTKPSDKYNWKMDKYQAYYCAHYSINSKIAIFTTGGIISNVLEAIKENTWEYNSIYSVYNISQLNPFVFADNGPDLLSVLKTHKKIITVEEHSSMGLASIISEIIAQNGINATLYPIAIPNAYSPVYGAYNELLDWAGLSVSKIKEKIACIAEL